MVNKIIIELWPISYDILQEILINISQVCAGMLKNEKYRKQIATLKYREIFFIIAFWAVFKLTVSMIFDIIFKDLAGI